MAQRYADTTYLIRRVPEAAAVDAEDANALQYALDDAEPLVGLSAYRSRSELAHAYAAAHLLACRFPAIMGGEQGPQTSASAGEISAGFAASAAPTEDLLGSTRWGRLFQQQQRLASGSLRGVG